MIYMGELVSVSERDEVGPSTNRMIFYAPCRGHLEIWTKGREYRCAGATGEKLVGDGS